MNPNKKNARSSIFLLIFLAGLFGTIALVLSGPSPQTAEAPPAAMPPSPQPEPPAAAAAEPPAQDAAPPLSMDAIAKGRGSWPERITASIPLDIEKGVTVPAGAPLDVEDISSQGVVTVRAMGKLFQLDAADTDLEARAIAIRERNRLEAEALIQAEVASIEAERQELLAVVGPQPRRDPWTGGTVAVQRYLKANLKDPGSVEYLGWGAPAIVDREGEPYWKVRVRYRAKNSFGAQVVESQTFYLRNDTVLFTDAN